MDNQLKNYTAQPDPEVWEKIENTLHRRALRRRWAKAGAGVIAIAAVVVAVIFRPSPDIPAADTTLVAQATQTTVESPVMPNDVPTKLQQSPSDVPTSNAKQAPVATIQPTVESIPATEKNEVTAAIAETTTPQNDPSPATVAPAQPQTTNITVPPAEEIEVAETINETEQLQTEPKSAVNSSMDDTILWIPNAFTPASNDGTNTVFKPRLSHPGESISNYKMAIYNRRGMLVFRSDSLNQGWNGTYNGRPMPQGAYVYIIYYTDKDNLRHTRKGTITLIR